MTAPSKKLQANTVAEKPLQIDFRDKAPLPGWVREVIETHLAIESEDARSAGALGFMARALVIATMPYKDPKSDVFKRENGNFHLRIVAGYEGGIPYGIYPRLLMSWLTTEAVRKQSPVIELGDSLSDFLRNVLEMRNITGGAYGTGTRVVEQMKRLFGSMVSAKYHDKNAAKGAQAFAVNNVLIADRFDLGDASGDYLWKPQDAREAGQWKSQVRLNESFFREIIDRPVPIDLRAYKALRGSPMAMDIYSWLTYRMSYVRAPSRPIPWEALMAQFGSGYSTAQAARDFKKGFIKALKLVQVVYPQAKALETEKGLILKPSPTHVPITSLQRKLF